VPTFKVKITHMFEEVADEYVEADTLEEAKEKAAQMLADDQFDLDWRDGDDATDPIIENVSAE
jgi:hypothetical protein